MLGSWIFWNPSGTTLVRRIWSGEEEDALKRAVQRFGAGSWKEIKDSEPSLMNRSIVQIREKVLEEASSTQFLNVLIFNCITTSLDAVQAHFDLHFWFSH
jgi:hypothetical protein